MKFLNWFKPSDKNDVPELKGKSSGMQNIQLNEDIFKSLFDKKIPETDQFKLIESFIQEGQYFKQNQILFSLGSQIHGSGRIYIQPRFSGKIEKIFIKPDVRISFNSNLFSVVPITDEELINNEIFNQNREFLEDTQVVLLKDDFTSDRTIKVTKVATEETPFFKLYQDQTELAHDYLGLSFVNHNGVVYISFNSRNEDVTLSKGDSLIFLFEDKSKLEFVLQHSGEGTKGYRFNHASIGFEELNTFLSKDLWKVKLISNRKNIYSIYHMNQNINENIALFDYQKAQYSNQKEGQYLLRFITGKFIEMNQNHKI